MHINGLVDNGRGSGLRDDLSGERRTVHGVFNREHFTCVGNACRRRLFLSGANFSAENFRGGAVYGGRGVVVVEGIVARRGELLKKIFKGAIEMQYVSIVDAKDKFAELITLLNQNHQEEVYLTFGGKPIIKMSRVEEAPVENRIGIAKGKFTIPADFDKWDEEIAEMFGGSIK